MRTIYRARVMATVFHVTATTLQHKIMKLLSGKLFPPQYLLIRNNSALVLLVVSVLLKVLRKDCPIFIHPNWLQCSVLNPYY